MQPCLSSARGHAAVVCCRADVEPGERERLAHRVLLGPSVRLANGGLELLPEDAMLAAEVPAASYESFVIPLLLLLLVVRVDWRKCSGGVRRVSLVLSVGGKEGERTKLEESWGGLHLAGGRRLLASTMVAREYPRLSTSLLLYQVRVVLI